MYNDPGQQPPPPPQYQGPPMTPPQPPKSKPLFFSRKLWRLPIWAWCVIGFIALVIIANITSGAGASLSNTSIQPTTQPNEQNAQVSATAKAFSTQYAQSLLVTPTIAPTDTPAPTQPPAKWTTVRTFTGHGEKKTGSFSVPDDWRIVWHCDDTADTYGIGAAFYVSVYNSDGTVADANAVGAQCAAGKVTTDNTEEHQSGDVYLDINAGVSWSIDIQEYK